MTIKVSAQGLFQYLVGAGIATAALFLGVQQPGTSQTAPAPETLSAASSNPIPIIPSQSLNPMVPPLDDPGLFLPSLETAETFSFTVRPAPGLFVSRRTGGC